MRLSEEKRLVSCSKKVSDKIMMEETDGRRISFAEWDPVPDGCYVKGTGAEHTTNG
jgi:hypothetical protein